MSEYISTNGRNRLAIGICGRCSMKFALDDLSPDINYPGLMVCGTPGTVNGKNSWSGGSGCSDAIDPYRLPAHETEDITLDMPRPDTHLPLPGYVTVAPGDSNWPTTTFLGGDGAAQLPATGVIPFKPGQPVIPTTGEVP